MREMTTYSVVQFIGKLGNTSLIHKGDIAEVTLEHGLKFIGEVIEIFHAKNSHDIIIRFKLKIYSNDDGDIEVSVRDILSYNVLDHNKTPKLSDSMVNHPNHYQSEAGLEVIDVIEAFTAKLTGIEASDTANVIKYICRWNEKNGVQDLEKAKWYLEHLINHVKNKTEKEN